MLWFIDAVIIRDQYENLIGTRKLNKPKHSVQHQFNKVPWFTRGFMDAATTVFGATVYYTPYKSRIPLDRMQVIFDKTYWLGAPNYLCFRGLHEM